MNSNTEPEIDPVVSQLLSQIDDARRYQKAARDARRESPAQMSEDERVEKLVRQIRARREEDPSRKGRDLLPPELFQS
jgi:hypothetical protein